jgi:hypothetical protein
VAQQVMGRLEIPQPEDAPESIRQEGSFLIDSVDIFRYRRMLKAAPGIGERFVAAATMAWVWSGNEAGKLELAKDLSAIHDELSANPGTPVLVVDQDVAVAGLSAEVSGLYFTRPLDSRSSEHDRYENYLLIPASSMIKVHLSSRDSTISDEQDEGVIRHSIATQALSSRNVDDAPDLADKFPFNKDYLPLLIVGQEAVSAYFDQLEQRTKTETHDVYFPADEALSLTGVLISKGFNI